MGRCQEDGQARQRHHAGLCRDGQFRRRADAADPRLHRQQPLVVAARALSQAAPAAGDRPARPRQIGRAAMLLRLCRSRQRCRAVPRCHGHRQGRRDRPFAGLADGAIAGRPASGKGRRAGADFLDHRHRRRAGLVAVGQHHAAHRADRSEQPVHEGLVHQPQPGRRGLHHAASAPRARRCRSMSGAACCGRRSSTT